MTVVWMIGLSTLLLEKGYTAEVMFKLIQKMSEILWEFPGGPVMRTL